MGSPTEGCQISTRGLYHGGEQSLSYKKLMPVIWQVGLFMALAQGTFFFWFSLNVLASHCPCLMPRWYVIL